MKFEVGKTYSVDGNQHGYRFHIAERTPKTVTYFEHSHVARASSPTRRKIHIDNGIEWFYPFGKYSMAAFVGADNEIGVSDNVLQARRVLLAQKDSHIHLTYEKDGGV